MKNYHILQLDFKQTYFLIQFIMFAPPKYMKLKGLLLLLFSS